MELLKLLLLVSSPLLALADSDLEHVPGHRQQLGRRGRQQSVAAAAVAAGGVDFTGCVTDPDTGYCCIDKEEKVTSLQKDPILECTHKNVEKCHYTYVTQFSPAQEEVCEENFEKKCQVTFKQQAQNETLRKCYKPLEKVCNGDGPEECRTVYESSCSTRYIEKQPGKFVGDTKCEKLPIEICGAGCTTQDGAEECHDKTQTTLIDVPEESCDLNPQKTCRLQTKLVPKLSPKAECTTIPQEVCSLKFSTPQQVDRPLKSRWCRDPTPPVPDNTGYEETQDTPPVITLPPETASESQAAPQTTTLPSYNRPSPPSALYDANEIRSGREDNFFTDELPPADEEEAVEEEEVVQPAPAQPKGRRFQPHQLRPGQKQQRRGRRFNNGGRS